MSEGPGTYKYITSSHYGPDGGQMLHEPGVDPRADYFRERNLAQKKAAAASAAAGSSGQASAPAVAAGSTAAASSSQQPTETFYGM